MHTVPHTERCTQRPHAERCMQRPHEERHVLEVCQFETPAVFTRVTLPAYAGQDKLSNETKRFDK